MNAASAGRLDALKRRMAETGTDLVALGPGAHMHWLLGFHPHPDERPCLLLVGREREVFLMPALNAEGTREHTKIPFCTWTDAEGPAAALKAALEQSGAAQAASVAVDETVRADFALLALDALPGARRLYAADTVGPLRMRKDASEFAEMQMNSDIADLAMRAAFAAVAPGVSEAAIAAEARRVFAEHGAAPLFTIVGAGPNGAFPHHQTGDRKVASNDAIVIDIGARKGTYSSDITRMAVVGDGPEGYAEVHATVEAAVQAGLDAAKPGVKAHTVDDAARSTIADAGYGEYFVHRTGHGIGVEGHEPPYITATSTTVLESGMAFSIEPGIYLPGRFGVRLEEIVVLQEDGPKILSSLPRDAHVVGDDLMGAEHDPFTAAVIQASLVAAADEMFAVLKKTAMSPIIYEVLDVGTGITDADGELVSSGAGIPTFVGVLDKAVKRILELNDRASIRAGDVFVTNDPYYGGVTHLNDVVIAQPVFAGEEMIAWAASIAHWNDVGGAVAGSMSTDVSEIFQEGLRLPAVKLFDAGEAIASVFDIIAVNSRLPEFVRGDLWAQVAAGRRAARRIGELAGTHGLETFRAALAALFEEGERRGLAGLAELPSGRYEIEEEQDDGAVWKAAIVVADDRFTVDLRGNPAQRNAPYNTSRDGAVISAQMIFKALTDPSLFANAGSFRALEVLTEPGTIFHATGTAPHGYYFETRIRLYDMLWQCMARAMPERLPAGHFASICGTVIAGVHPDTGRRYTMVEPQMGGWGATSTRDGLDAMYSCSHGETYNCPVEIAEARYGLSVGHKSLGDGEEGRGLHSGGKGLSISYRLHGDAVLSAGYSRNRVPVWGSNGGEHGGTNGFTLVRGGERSDHAFASGVALAAGDEVLIHTANGGGWGKA